MFLKPENGACNQKITPALKLFSKPQKVSPKPEIAISTENQCFLNRKMVLVIVNSPTKGFGLAQLPKFQASRLVSVTLNQFLVRTLDFSVSGWLS